MATNVVTSSESSPEKGSGVTSKVMPVLSVLFTGLALTFVGRKVWVQRSALQSALADIDVLPSVLALVLAVGAMSWIALIWPRIITQLGGSFSTSPAIRAYYLGEIGKYIPGGLWPILGRGELARRAGVPASVAYPSVLLSLLLVYLSAALMVVGLVPPLGLVEELTPVGYLGLAGFLAAGLGLLTPRFVYFVKGLVPVAALDRIPVLEARHVIRFLFEYLPTWLFVGFSTSAVAVAVAGDVDLIVVAVAAVTSWLVGFLAVPVPGGLGVRESVFVLLAGLGELDGLAVALVARFLFVLVDVLGFLVAFIDQKTRRP